jgi:serine/threonine protein kinase
MIFCTQCKRWMSAEDAFCPDDGGAGETLKAVPEGAKIKDYKVVRKLGEGGMGYVLEATHEVLNRRTAIKFLLPQFATNNVVVTRFLQEAKSVNMINHENIINIYDYGYAPDKSVYFVMEYLEGEELSKFHKRLGKVPLELLFPVYLQIMKALAAAHDKEIVHRDLKPANVFLQKRDGNPYFVKVLDFGVAKLRGEGKIENLTRAGALLGTPQFMSPEQVGGEPVDARSDVFSLSIMLYRAATGKLPFTGQGFAALANQICLEEPPAPRSVAADLPEELEKIILKGLIKEKDKRYQSVREMLQDFEALRVKLGLSEKPPIQTEEEALATARAAAMANEAQPQTHSDGSTNAAALQGNTQDDINKAPQIAQQQPVPAKSNAGMIIGVVVALAAVIIAVVVFTGGGEPPNNTTNNTLPPPTKPKEETLADKAEAKLEAAIKTGEGTSKVDAAKAVAAVASGRSVRLLALVYLALEKGSPQASKETVLPLANLKLPESTEKLRQKLGSVDSQRAAEISAALLSIGDTAGVKQLEKFFTGTDIQAKILSAVALAKNKSQDPAVKTFLTETMAAGTPGSGSWLQSAEGLLVLGDEEAKKQLNAELASTEPLRMIKAAEILARNGDTAAKDSLARWVQQADFTQRAEASLALSRLGDNASFAIVEEGLKDIDAETRYASVVSVGRFPDKGASHKATIEKLFAEDPSAKVQLAAAAALLTLQ